MIRKEAPVAAKPIEFPKWQEPHRVTPTVAPVPLPPQPVQVEIKNDNSYLVAIVQKQQEQLNALATKFDAALVQLVAAIQKLEPGKGFFVDIASRDHQGRISSIKVRKE